MAASKNKPVAKVVKKSAAASNAGPQPAPASQPTAAAASNGGTAGLRVRMYRVGFGDFFLLTVPTGAGPKHILIDCGVHAKDLGSIQDAVAQMASDCGSELALVIMTHRHADHISGFGKCSDAFSKITVERVWMPWFEDPKNAAATAFQAGLTALAGGLQMKLAARSDEQSQQFADMAENITGGMAAAGGVSANQKALDVLHNGFMNKPDYDYYQAGDAPVLPKSLVGAVSAQILGPPIDPNLVSKMTNKTQQYLTDDDPSDDGKVTPFSNAFRADSYPKEAFRFFPADQIKKMIGDAQPDVLAAQAVAADNTLNNQSLVVLFSVAGKNLLFAGDAQWGNWENFLYGGAYGTPGHTELTDRAKTILGKIDFYKVGHHGSANATPKDAVAAMRHGCVGMCSTQIDAYNEVPRGPLLQALGERMDGQLARSDQVAVSSAPINPGAGLFPSKFKRPTGTLFIDYEF